MSNPKDQPATLTVTFYDNATEQSLPVGAPCTSVRAAEAAARAHAKQRRDHITQRTVEPTTGHVDDDALVLEAQQGRYVIRAVSKEA